MPSDRFEFAKWSLQQKGDPEPLRKELARLEKTSIGSQVVEAQALLAGSEDDPEPAAASGE
jgi:hypothetical protein